ncbi:MAG: dual specificity protein phosphatase family protein [bacterium]|nr:dual specificity protein phosphatase family protein [bacterium]
MPHFFSWIVPGQLAGMGRPGCGLELSGEMMSHEQRFWSWLMFSRSLQADRMELAERIGLQGLDAHAVERRMVDLYKKFRDWWGILGGYTEGFGAQGAFVDRFDLSSRLLEEDLAFLNEQGIHTLVSLTEQALDEAALSEHSLEALHMPIPDKEAPEPEQVDQFVDFLDEKLSQGNRVLVHCLGGYGRTGTMLACYLVHCGGDPQAMLDEIRRLRPQSVETESQEAAIFAYGERVL